MACMSGVNSNVLSEKMEGKIVECIYELTKRMIEYYKGDPDRISHFMKVHGFAKQIGEGEALNEKALLLLEAAALVHDIGIKPAEEKYGSCDGKLQEQEGPAPARVILDGLGFEPDDIERICYLVAHHHTYTNVDGKDYRILLEADFLVNLYEQHNSGEEIEAALKNIFRTDTGISICKKMYAIETAV